MIEKRNDGFYVVSHSGKTMGGPYKTREEAQKRMAQVEAHKKMSEEKNGMDKKKKMMKCFQFTKGVFYKAVDSDFYTEGFVATSHLDDAHLIPEELGGTGLPDYIPHSTLQSIADQINTLAGAGAASLHHNRESQVVGVAKEASVKRLSDGEYGVYVVTQHNAKHPEFDTVKYEVENGMLSGYSIEYDPVDFHFEVREGKEVRVLDDIRVHGYGLASRPINPHAAIVDYEYKELLCFSNPNLKEGVGGGVVMAEEKTKVVEAVESKEAKVEAPKIVEAKESFSQEEYSEFLKFKEMNKAREHKEAIKKEVEAVLAGMNFKAPLKADARVEAKELEFKELKDYKEAVSKGKPIQVQYKAAAALINKDIELSAKAGVPDILRRSENAPGVTEKFVMGNKSQNWDIGYQSHGKLSVKEGEGWTSVPQKAYGNLLQVKELSLQYKDLETDTNAGGWTYGSYNLSPAEMNDVFQPVIINQLNEQRTVWNTLQKVDFSAYSQIQFRIRTTRNSTAGGQLESFDMTSNYTGNSGRRKISQPFSYYYVMVRVTGPEIALSQAPGGIGDVYAAEVSDATEDLLRILDRAVIGTGAGTAENASLGFEGLIITTGNLYGIDVTSIDAGANNFPRYPLEAAAVTNAGSVRITLERIRTTISSCVNNGANQNDLVMYSHRTQQDFIRALIQDMQRIVPTSARVGFEGVIEVDGVPVLDDVNINTDDIFFIDSAHTKIGLKVAPTYEETAKTIDARNGFIKCYWNLYSDKPSHNAWVHTLATS